MGVSFSDQKGSLASGLIQGLNLLTQSPARAGSHSYPDVSACDEQACRVERMEPVPHRLESKESWRRVHVTDQMATPWNLAASRRRFDHWGRWVYSARFRLQISDLETVCFTPKSPQAASLVW